MTRSKATAGERRDVYGVLQHKKTGYQRIEFSLAQALLPSILQAKLNIIYT